MLIDKKLTDNKQTTEVRTDRCPICGHSDARDMGKPRISDAVQRTEVARVAEDVRILGCRQCRFYYCSPRVEMSAETMTALYDSDYFGEDTSWNQRCRRITVPERTVGWLEDLCECRVEDFLEVGSGEGFTLQAASKKGWHTVGVEVSPAFAEPVSSRLGGEVLRG